MSIYKYKGVYTKVIEGLNPIDLNDRVSEHKAIQLALPEYFHHKAKVCWKYFSSSAAIFAYKGKIVVTDETLILSFYHGIIDGREIWTDVRWTCDEWSDLEQILDERYNEFDEEERNQWEKLYAENPEFDSVVVYNIV